MTKGLKSKELRSLEKLYRRKIPKYDLIHLDLGRELASVSSKISKQVAILIDRQGLVRFVIVGGPKAIEIPELGRSRTGTNRLRGLRCIHTHLEASELSNEDLNDMASLRLDYMSAIEVKEDGETGKIHIAHLLPQNLQNETPNSQKANKQNVSFKAELWEKMTFQNLEDLSLNIESLTSSLEDEIYRVQNSVEKIEQGEKTLLVHVDTGEKNNLSSHAQLQELSSLARGAGLTPVWKISQKRNSPDNRYVIGKGLLSKALIQSLFLGVEVIVFSNELTPSQIKSLSDYTDLKIIDRTQVILDIFSQRAKSRVGKLQVELAQLRYMLPKISTKHTALSRLTGGIGGRGPGETKLEVHRRKAFDRINNLKNELKKLQKKRSQGRRLRKRKQIPVISLVGCTNAGKSTILNSLTNSDVFAGDKLFATLDTSSRRMRYPSGEEFIFTDTVGFISSLPKYLVESFRSTLEELDEAHLLLHIVDASSPHCEENIENVKFLLNDLGLSHKPTLMIFNKIDKLDNEKAMNLSLRYEGIMVEGRNSKSVEKIKEACLDKIMDIKNSELIAI